jgi:hypothetical protein
LEKHTRALTFDGEKANSAILKAFGKIGEEVIFLF